MAQSKGELQPAQIYDVDETGSKLGTVSISCMFNPFEYTVSKSNTFQKKPKNNADVVHAEFKEAGSQTLKLNLVFDTYEDRKDVSKTTNQLWKLMETKTRKEGDDTKKVPPPYVAFEWGVFRFVSVITNMTQRFTLFLPDGTPVRAMVDVTFTQFNDLDDYGKQNPTSGGGPMERIWQVKAGDRLDAIAMEVYNDATKWRYIAERNRIVHPLQLQPGQQIVIPQEP